MSLDEKRTELEQKILDGEIDIRKVFVLIKEQDRQSIKELRERLQGPIHSKIIKEIFGEGLT